MAATNCYVRSTEISRVSQAPPAATSYDRIKNNHLHSSFIYYVVIRSARQSNSTRLTMLTCDYVSLENSPNGAGLSPKCTFHSILIQTYLQPNILRLSFTDNPKSNFKMKLTSSHSKKSVSDDSQHQTIRLQWKVLMALLIHFFRAA